MSLLDRIKDESLFTPDFIQLNSSDQDEFLVFVTGRMRRHRDFNWMIDGANYYGRGLTWNDNFIFKRVCYDTQEPLIFQFPRNNKKLMKEFENDFNYENLGHVEGDLYGVPLRLLTKIDRFEYNESGVKREKLMINMIDINQPNKKVVEAFTYVVDFDHYREYSSYHSMITFSCAMSKQDGKRIYYFNG